MRHDAQQLKESLSIDDIKTLLTELGAEHIPEQLNNRGELITNTICHNPSGGSHKLYYSDSHKSFRCFTGCSESFDIYELVKRVYEQRNVDIHFRNIVDYVAQKTGRSFGFASDMTSHVKVSEEMEWLSRFSRNKVEFPPLKTYSDRILDVFSHHMGHPEFTNDGISEEAMDTFDIRYYNTENALVIPHRNLDGKIVGMMQRNLDPYQVSSGYKYLPTTVQSKLYNFSKHQNLYGLYENFSNIKRMGKVAIFESEKSVMQIETMYGRESNFSVALGGKNMSQFHIDMLLDKAEISEVVLCLDKEFNHHEDVEAERFAKLILNMGRRLSPYTRVYTIWDTEDLLKRDMSPSDAGSEVLKQLMFSKREILNKE